MTVYKFKATPMMRQDLSTKKIMNRLLLALSVVYIFGLINVARMGSQYVIHSLAILLVALAGTLGTELLYAKLAKKELKSFLSSSFGWITAVILAQLVPADASLYAVFMSAVLGIFFSKLVFGGFGQNIFNPAGVARAIFATSFVSKASLELISSATPAVSANSVSWLMSKESFGLYLDNFGGLKNLFFGFYHGAIGETSALLLLVVMVYLILTETIDYLVPLTYLGVCFLASLIVGAINGLGLAYPLMFIFTGGIMYGAVFMLTDPVTSPVSRPGRVVFAAFAALCTCLIRYLGNLPEGVVFSILLANMVSCLIDKIFVGKQLKDLKRNTLICIGVLVVAVVLIVIAGCSIVPGEYVTRSVLLGA